MTKLSSNNFFSFLSSFFILLSALFILSSLSLVIKVPQASALACNNTNYTGDPYCVPVSVCSQDGGHTGVGGSCSSGVCCCPSGASCKPRNPTNTPTTQTNYNNVIATSTTNSTNWRAKETYYYNGGRSHYGPVTQNSNPTSFWDVNKVPASGEYVTWYTACVDPNTTVNVHATLIHDPDCPGGHCYLYETPIDVSCRTMGANGTANRVYAGCGSNYGNNFGTVGPDSACPTNSCYCTKGGITSYPNNCCSGGKTYCAANGYSCGNPPAPTHTPTPTNSPLNAPNVTAGASCNSSSNPVINLDWNAVNNANSYDVDYKRSNASTWTNGANNTTSTAYNITGIVEGVDYDWRVRAVNSGGNSGYDTGQTRSATCAVAPNAPNVTAGASCNAGNNPVISLDWNAVANASSYDVGYKRSNVTTWTTGANNTTSTAYNVTGITQGVSYDWRVRSVSAGGTSGYDTGQTQSATCTVPPPTCPLAINATSTCNGSNNAYIDVSWNNISGANSYDLRYKTSASTTWITNTGVTSSYRIPASALTNSTSYNYQVRAVNSGGNSGWCPTNAATVSTPPCTPGTQDLIVSTFTFPGGVDTGNSSPTVIVKNIGNTAVSDAFYVGVDTIQGGGGVIKESPEITTNIAPGATLNVSSYFTGMARPNAGNYTAQATTDYRNNVIESNENNNTTVSAYTTTSSTTDLTVHIYYDYNGNGAQGTGDDDAASWSFTVNNGTTVRSTNNAGDFLLTNLAAGNYDINPTLPNTNWTITTPVRAVEPGTSVINIGIRPPAPTCSGGLVANPNSGNPPFNSALTATGCTTSSGGTPNYSWPAPDYGTTDDVNNRATTWHSTPDTYAATTVAHPVVTVCNTGTGNVACRSYTTNINVIPLFSITGNIFLDISPENQIKNAGENNITGAVSVSRVPASGTITTKVDGTSPTYTINNLPSGNYRVSYSPSGYTMTYPQNGPPPQFNISVGPNCNASIAGINSAICTNGSISALNFGVTNSVAWIQTGGADIWVQDGVNNPVPSSGSCGTTPVIMSTDKNGTPGIIYSGNSTFNFCPPGTCQNRSSSQQWVVGGLSYPETYTPSTPGVIKTSFAYLSGVAAKNGVSPIPSITTIPGCGSLASCKLPSDATFPSGIYLANGDLHITSNGSATVFPSGKDYIILVKGDLYLDKEVQVPAGSTALFSAGRKSDGTGGNIHVAASVGNADPTDYTTMNLQGWYSADDSFILDGGNICPTAAERLNVAGAIVVNAALQGGNFDYSQRSLCAGNLTCPVFYITERPDFTLNAPSFLQVAPRIWQEVAP